MLQILTPRTMACGPFDFVLFCWSVRRSKEEKLCSLQDHIPSSFLPDDVSMIERRVNLLADVKRSVLTESHRGVVIAELL